MRTLVMALIFFVSIAETFAAGCGSRGGPGYRGPDGRCVGWKALHKTCGTPPTTRCTYEGPGGDDDDALRLIPPAIASPGSSPITSNAQHTRAPGIACADQAESRALALCEACAQDLAEAIAAARCVAFPAGVPVLIEAGDYSFDWLRVRIGGRGLPMWAPRAAILER